MNENESTWVIRARRDGTVDVVDAYGSVHYERLPRSRGAQRVEEHNRELLP